VEPARPAPVEPARPVPVEPARPVPMEPAPVATATPPPAPTPPLASVPRPPYCGPPEIYCVAPRTAPVGHQLPPDPASLSYDGNGCLAGSDHAHGCTGKTALSGPRFDNGQCCYTMCQGPVPPCGRPLMVEGQARVAASTSGASAWCAEVAPQVTPLPLRDRLAAAWRRDGRFEHASVASFGRFALELLAVGAPPQLVAEAQRAASDEIEHAQLCFGLAAAYGGIVGGVGPLPLSDLRIRTDLAEVAAAAVREGCIGETFAAHVADRGADVCRSPEVATVLRRIAADELRHAELAWRFVAWAAARGDDRVRVAIAEAFAHLPDVTDDAPVDREAWEAAGRFDAARQVVLRDEVMREVVAPAAATLASRAVI